MSWVRVDDKIAFHRKVVAAGNEAFGAWMRMTAWCADQLSDGIVPASIAWVIAGHGREEVIDRLVEVGLLERSNSEANTKQTHFVVHDYHDHNPLAADVKAKREETAKKRRDAGTKGGRVSAEVRSSKSEATSNQNEETNEAKSNPRTRSRSPSVKRERGASAPDPIALELFNEFEQARRSVSANTKSLHPTAANVGFIAARLAEGYTPDDVRHVIAVCVSEVQKGGDVKWFNPSAAFRPINFDRHLSTDPKAKPREPGAPARAEPLPFDQVFGAYKDELR